MQRGAIIPVQDTMLVRTHLSMGGTAAGRSLLRIARARSAAALALAAATIAFAAAPHAAAVRTDHVEAELVAAKDGLTPGVPAMLALRLKIEDGWHTYWRNPGDSGLPTTLEWKLPPGFTAGGIEWVPPKALPVGPLVNYGYEGEVLHLVTVTPPADLAPGANATLRARADWLVCKETCIPDGADVELTLPVVAGAAADSKAATALGAARAALPQPLTGWKASARGDGPRVELTLSPAAAASDPGAIRFFPYAEGRVEPSAPQTLVRNAHGDYVLTLPVASQLDGTFDRVAGVAVAANGFGNGGAAKAVEIDVPMAGTVTAGAKPKLDAPSLNTSAPAGAATMSLAAAVLLALVGGLVLNLMPCVLPVLSLKALSLAGSGHTDRRVLRVAGLAFALGVVATFVALAVALVALRAAGEQVGWGFQLQSPAVVASLAMLFFVLALNLSGVFEFATIFPGVAGWSLRNRYADAALSGVLAVVIASPCTAPFMGAALGFALSQTTAATLAVFVALGVGMALPFTLLSWFPGWRRALPRPGAWMERLKQLLAFPLYATVAWLAWVLGAQVDNDAVARLLATLVILAFALWAWRNARRGAAVALRVTALVAVAAALVVAWPLFRGDAMAEAAARSAATRDSGGWLAFAPARVEELTRAGRPVFVDFTAAWCVTCQVNKRLVLNRADVREAFARDKVALMRADWTRRDPAITRALAGLNRNGVPVYVLYRPGREPLLLPEVLQKQTVVDALATL